MQVIGEHQAIDLCWAETPTVDCWRGPANHPWAGEDLPTDPAAAALGNQGGTGYSEARLVIPVRESAVFPQQDCARERDGCLIIGPQSQYGTILASRVAGPSRPVAGVQASRPKLPGERRERRASRSQPAPGRWLQRKKREERRCPGLNGFAGVTSHWKRWPERICS
jgi:hypothetical protein